MNKIRRYAEGTTVPVERTRVEIERLVRTHGASGFATAWDKARYVVMFELRGRRIKFSVPTPDTKQYRSTKAWAQEERRRWRSLLLILKAKLELVQSGDADFESEFLAYLVLPGGEVVGERILAELDKVLNGAPLPPLLGQ